MSQTPEQLADKMLELSRHNESDLHFVGDVKKLLTAHDVEVRAEALAQAADALTKKYHAEFQIGVCRAREIILTLSPDPHSRERIELEARIAELKRSVTLTQVNDPERWPDLYGRIKYLESKLAALDAPKGEVK